MVMRDQGMLNGVIVGDCRWERFWYRTEESRIKSGGRHSGEGERVVNRNVTVFGKISSFKYTVPVCFRKVVYFCSVARIRDG